VSVWLQRLAPRPAATIRLFCFHHAGGSAALFRLWPQKLAEMDVCAIQLPGRANRLCDEPVPSIPALVDALVPQLLPHLDRPYAMFGHSMGSILASAVAHRLVALGAPLPQHLFVSGRHPPHMANPEPSLRGLSDAGFVAEIDRRYGGFPPEVMAHPELVELLLPALRSDIEALEAFRPTWTAPLPVPIIACGGVDDHCTPRAHLEAWQADTAHPLRIRMFPGDHFYLDECLDEIAAELRSTLAPALATA
jgi:medium-chain acyl-[acyl-carrier-protein] hydrolase